jgi:ribosome-binding protein aMBF1 (putative translation factor)
MIRTDAEYEKAQEKLDQEQETLQRQREQLEEMDLSEEEVERALEPMVSFRDQLREEIETYEQMRRGDLSALHDLRSIGRWLIGARIAKGWSLSQLADELSVSVQQVSRDEQNEYKGITTHRAQRILDALGVRFRLEVEEPVLDDENDQEVVAA